MNNRHSQYTDPADAFVPYDTQQPHGTYDQGGYNYGGYTDDPHRSQSPTAVASHEPSNNFASGFDPDEYPAPIPRQKGPNGVRARSYVSHENLWTRGGKARCCGRFFCCTLMTVVFLFVSIVLAIVLWVRPPSIAIGSIGPVSSGSTSTFNVSSSEIDVNLAANISVANPNFFSVNLPSIKVQLFYPINNTAVGGGQVNNVNIRSNQQTNFTVPFMLRYNLTADPSHTILTDLINKCSNSQSLTVDYRLTLGIRVIFFTISPVISNPASFSCPFTAQEIAGALNGSGISV